jgi:preprotein translocase subunit SecE
LVEQQTPNLPVGGSSPSWPAIERRKKIMISVTQVTQFIKDVHSELSKVTWPKFDEFVGSTIVVLLLMSFFSIYLGLVDKGLTELFKVVVKLYSGY